ncbi:nucleotidyltransferase domain-containing protein [Maribellus luteus]|uniref:Nucleotidyltransferase domain-containing protein n=1 Tax=Maribellus luteus TaxID=2305463 RepID=A0A399SW57_9BACT|nr:nucleotidyltransferase domain-containing protein [Maribellus luteus]RIJ48290.1 nucleotidyltransferase domain-containing protein [Maribellus luteus]
MQETTKYGLPETDFKKIIAILKAKSNVKQAVLFGSRAKGTFTSGSDVDIALLGDELKLADILEISADIDQLFLPWKFDLVIFSRIKEEALLDHINRVGIKLFC